MKDRSGRFESETQVPVDLSSSASTPCFRRSVLTLFVIPLLSSGSEPVGSDDRAWKVGCRGDLLNDPILFHRLPRRIVDESTYVNLADSDEQRQADEDRQRCVLQVVIASISFTYVIIRNIVHLDYQIQSGIFVY